MIKTLGVIGGGVLGNAVARGFMEWAEVRVFDLDVRRGTHTLSEAASSDVVMICLPTPAGHGGICNTTAIDDFLDEAKANRWWWREACYVIRSTVPVGYTERMAMREGGNLPLFHSPEFLTARCSVVDFQVPARNIVGTPAPRNDRQYVNWAYSYQTLTDLYSRRFPGVPVHDMTSNESELVKLACNSFFATKVAFFNLLRKTAELHGCDWDRVRGGVLSDGRIAHAHTSVPGPSGEWGYGGACLPKDVANFKQCAPVAYQFLVEAIEEFNAKVRREPSGG